MVDPITGTVLSGATLGIMVLWLIRKIFKKVKHSDCMVSTDKDTIKMNFDHSKSDKNKDKKKDKKEDKNESKKGQDEEDTKSSSDTTDSSSSDDSDSKSSE